MKTTLLSVYLTAFFYDIICSTANGQFTNGQAASFVLGQPDFTTGTSNTSQGGMYLPQGVALDKSGNLYVADYNNSRVLIFKSVSSKSNGANADYVLGQSDFTSSTQTTTQNGMTNPTYVTMDTTGNLYVTDDGNSRVLIFKGVESKVDNSTLSNGANADFVLGQSDFTSGFGFTTTQSSMDYPASACLDNSGNLYVADQSHSRVLIFKGLQTKVNDGTLSNGANADFVLGQTDFTSSSGPVTEGATQSDLYPYGVAIDASGNLYVTDPTYNNRLLIFANVMALVNAGTLSNGENASYVIGAPDFTTTGSTTTAQNTITNEGADWVDASGNLYVTDLNADRIMIFKGIESKVNGATLNNYANADGLLGGTDFNAFNGGSPSTTTFAFPYAAATDAGGDLYVADWDNNRVLKFTNSTLPVTMLNFSANMPDNVNVHLTWSTAFEENSDHFTVRRSTDGLNYIDLGKVQAAGNISSTHNYEYSDNIAKISFDGIIYYQLQEVDIDGNVQLSPVLTVKPDGSSPNSRIWPNPFTDHLQISISTSIPETVAATIISSDGKVVHRQVYSLSPGVNQVSILNLQSLPAGLYRLTAIAKGKIILNKSVLKN